MQPAKQTASASCRVPVSTPVLAVSLDATAVLAALTDKAAALGHAKLREEVAGEVAGVARA